MTTFDPNTATLEACIEFLADRFKHPIPATLDAAYWALPMGWRWYYIRWAHGLCLAYTVDKPQNSFDTRTCIGVADTELLARFRAACFALIEEEKK